MIKPVFLPPFSQAMTAPASFASSCAKLSPSTGLFAITQDYIEHVLPVDHHMKILFVDKTTLNIISMSCSQTTLLSRGVFLVDQIDNRRHQKEMKIMQCIIFIRPELASVEAACAELRRAKYNSYTIIFCGLATPGYLDRLASADVDSLVKRVEEVFCDFDVLNRDAFMIEMTPPHALLVSRLTQAQIKRAAEGLASLSLAQRRRPVVRFQQNSAYARRVAAELDNLYRRDLELFDYRSKDTILLILDRSDDPVTPLLTPWTYQAMLHEYIGLDHNLLRLPQGVNGKEGPRDFVFSEKDDLFFAENMCNNWGDLCNNVKTYVDKCKDALNIDRSTATMEELKQFMQRIPQTKSLTASVAKHTTVVTHLSAHIKERDLLQISLLEQDMVATHDLSNHWARLEKLALRGDIQATDLLRLCLLFHLRYEKPGQPLRTTAILEKMGSAHARFPQKLRTYYGRDQAAVDGLFADTGVMAKIVKTFVDVGNIYTQHEPVLKRTLLQLLSGRLDENQYPYAGITTAPSVGGDGSDGGGYKPKEVIVYMCGGYTFEEAALVHGINCKTAYKPTEVASFASGGNDVKVIIGAESVLSSSSFIELLSHAS